MPDIRSNKEIDNSENPIKSMNQRNNDALKILSEPQSGSALNTGHSREPSIAAEGDKIYVVWHDWTDWNDCGKDCEIFYRYFDGSDWSDIQVISEPILGQNNGNGGYGADIAVENGNIYVTWSGSSNLSGEGDDGDIYFRCNLSGTGWDPIQVISEPVVGQDFNIGFSWQSRIAVDDGKIYITWTDENNTNNATSTSVEPEDIFFRSNITGTSWDDIQVISEPEFGKDLNDGVSWFPDIAADNGSVYVTWGDNYLYGGSYDDWDIFYRSNISGSGWNDIEVPSEPIPGIDINIDVSWSPKIAVENDNVYLIWEDYNETNASGSDQDIQFRCKLSGKSWGPIRVVSEPVEDMNINTGDSWEKDIAVENGNVYVVWEDDNKTFDCEKDLDIHYRCYTSGLGWGLIRVISEPVIGKNTNTKDSDYPSIAVSSGKVHVVWQDSNDTDGSGTDYDIFYKQVLPLILTEPKVKPRIGNTGTFFNFTVRYHNDQNIEPLEVNLDFDGTSYPMHERNPNDKNFLNGKRYYYNLTHLALGTHKIHFKAICGFNITSTPLIDSITVVNTPPELTLPVSQEAIEDKYFELKDFYYDIDVQNIAQPLFWNFSTNVDWLNFNSTEVTLNGTPTNDDVGEYWVYLEVDDTIAMDWVNVTITVTGINDNPVINTTDIELAIEDELYRVDYNATDIDSVKMNQEWTLNTSTSGWLTLNSKNGVLKGTPTNNDTGKFWVNVTVDDSDGGLAWSNFSLTILNINDAPMIINEDIVSAIIDEYYEIDFDAVDIDSVLTNQSWSMVTNASIWLTLDKSIGILNGTPSVTDLGWYTVNITVSDGDGGIDWHEFILEVIRPNAPPKILTKDNTTAIINVQYQTKYEASDDRTAVNNLIWTFKTNATDWLFYYPASVTIYGTPTESDIGTYWVNILVEDSDFAVAFHNFTLTVRKKSKPPINNPPLLSNPKLEPESGDTETEFIFTVHYFDLDDDPPTSILVVIDEVINNMALLPDQEPANGTYQCTIKLTKGEHTYYFSASDGFDSVKLDGFTTPVIKKSGSEPEESLAQYWLIWSVIFIIILTLIILSIIIQTKRHCKKKFETDQEQITEPSVTITKPVPIMQGVIPGARAKIIKTPAQIQAKSQVKPKPTLPIPPGIKLVGRDDELSKLLGHLAAASQGSGKTVFVTGEAGIGKTRLVIELKTLAEGRSFYVLQGNCISESMTPLLPFREALKSGGLDYLFAEGFPRIEAVYLLTHDGLLMKQIIRKETRLNPDLFAAMLVTVGNFVKESLSNLLGEGKEGALNTLGYENYRILIESGKTTNLVVVLSGRENEFLINEMREVFEKLNKHYGYLLSKWDGTQESIRGIESILQPLLSSGKYDGVSRREIGPRARRDMLFENVALGLVRQANAIPTLLILEDLQWSDPSSLALLYYIAKKIQDSRFLIIGTYRPEDIAAAGTRHPLTDLLQKLDRDELYDEIRLQRLPEDCIPEFLIYLLGQTEFTDEFRHRIYKETDGNPLFLIQLMKFMVEEKNLIYKDDRWIIKKDLEKIDIPSKIYNVIARRVDRLDKEYRKVLDFASVMGDTFTSAVLTDALNIDRIRLLEYLRDLEKTHRLIHSFDGKFKFDHEKIKAVLYNEMPTELKVEYHAIIGATIERQNKDSLDEVVGELAFHYYQCNNIEKALYYLKLAAEKAKKDYSNSEAIELYKKAIELESDKLRRIELYEPLGDIYYLIRNYDASITSYSEALKIADGNKKAELLAKAGGLLERSGKYDESLKLCKNALELVEGRDSKEEALALQNIGNVHLFKKNYSEAQGYYEKSLKIREKLDDKPGIGACHNNIGLVHYGKTEYNEALEHLNKSLELRKRLGDQEGIAATLSNIGAVFQMTREPDKAREYYSQSEDIRLKIGEPSSYDNSMFKIKDYKLYQNNNNI